MDNNIASSNGAATQSKNNSPVQATVVNVIIRDFIQLTEKLTPIQLAGLMSDYFEKVCTQVAQQQGIITSINNFGMVVIFTDAESPDSHARRALRCSLMIAMIAHQTRFWIKQIFPDQGLDKFGVGVGIHSGELIFAKFGLPPNLQQVASGHAVSVASLLATKSKELEWNIACSEKTLELAGHGVRINQRTLIGAEWLKEPVKAAELVVVRDVDEINDNESYIGLERTQVFKRGLRSGRYPAFDLAHHAASIEKLSENLPTIPGYRFIKPIGIGNDQSVFLVEQLRDGANLALKFVDGSVSEDSDMLYEFVEEYGLLEQIRHPNVLRIFDQGVTDDVLFILSEYLPEGALQQHIGNAGMKSEQAWNILHDIARALVEIHRVGIVHRDIKPEKILQRADGTAVLSDFGVARRIIKARHYELQDNVFGSSYFMSPEQAKREDEDERSDVYSLGAVFFNMLTGGVPYTGNTLEDILQQHIHAPIPKFPPQYRHLQSLLNRMMAKDKNERYTSDELLIYMDRLKEAL